MIYPNCCHKYKRLFRTGTETFSRSTSLERYSAEPEGLEIKSCHPEHYGNQRTVQLLLILILYYKICTNLPILFSIHN